jgi:hypothetical protein
MRASACCLLISGCVALSGCGASLPQLDINHPIDVQKAFNPDFDQFVRRIANHVVCEVRFAADSLYQSSPTSPRNMLKNWAAKVELDINATDTGDFNPGISIFRKTMSFALGINGKIESQGVNNTSITYFLPFDQIMTPGDHNPSTVWQYKCDQPSPEIQEPIEGTLGIQSILEAGVRLYDETGFVGTNLKSGPFDTISKTVSFQVTMSGNINPVWKFTHVSLITPGPVAQAMRVASNKLIITMGPNTLGTNTEVAPPTAPRTVRSVPTATSPLDESFFLERLKSVLSTRPTE